LRFTTFSFAGRLNVAITVGIYTQSSFVARGGNLSKQLSDPIGASHVYNSANQVKILLAEDSALYRSLIGGHLREWAFESVVVEDGQQAWDVLRQPDPPKLALLDWMLPHIDGIELCRRLRTLQATGNYIYAILLTAKDKKEDLIQALEAGADDYLAKPFDPIELRLRLMAGKRLLDLHEELVAARESLRVAATRDSMTGLLNRAEILTVFDRELARTLRECKPVAVLLADIDHFKTINDSLGHLAGDAVIKEVGKRLASSLRIYDGAGRYGGEEFLLILPGCELEPAIRRGEEIRSSISDTQISTPFGTIPVTMSIGIAVASTSTTRDPQAILETADKALYRAKHNGRNKVEATVLPGSAASADPG
jgi:two-component system cell cycle response regulator